MADVFISYAREDITRVRDLEHALKAHGLSAWRDEHDLEVNRDFIEEIEAQIASARAVVVCWSATAIGKKWVKKEANAAEAQGKYIGCLLDSTRPPFGFAELQSVELEGWNGMADDLPLLNLLIPVAKLAGPEHEQLAGLAPAKRLAIEEEKKREAASAAQRAQDVLERHHQEVEAEKRREREVERRKLDRRRSAKENAVRAIGLFYFAVNPFLLALAFGLLMPASRGETRSDEVGSAETLAVAIGWTIPWLITSGALWYGIAQPAGGKSIARWLFALSLPWAFVAWMYTQSSLPVDSFIDRFLIAVSAALVLAIVTALVRGKDAPT